MLFVYSQFVNEKVYEEAKHNFSEVYELHHQRTEGRSEGWRRRFLKPRFT